MVTARFTLVPRLFRPASEASTSKMLQSADRRNHLNISSNLTGPTTVVSR